MTAIASTASTVQMSSRYRTGAIGGLAFVVIGTITTFIAGVPPATDAPASTVMAYFRDHSTAIKLQQLIGGASIIGLLVFLGALWRIMSRAEGERPQLAIVSAIGLGMAIACSAVSGSITTSAAFRAGVLGDSAATLWTVSQVLFATAAFGLVAFHASVYVLTQRTRMLPLWTGYLALVTAAAFAAGTGGNASDATIFGVLNLVAFLLWSAWTIAVSACMLRAPRDAG